MELKAIRNQWQSCGISVGSGVSDKTILDFERRYNVFLPESVKCFYSHMDGMDNYEMDEALISFWPLSRIGSVPEKLSDSRGIPDYGGIELFLPETRSYFVFADHSIMVHVYAMKLISYRYDACPVVWVCGKRWHPLVNSFAEFIDRYAADPWSILAPSSLRKT